MVTTNYQITGHNLEVTKALHAFVIESLEKSFRHCTASPNIEVILRFSKCADVSKRNTAVINVRAMGKELISKTSTGADMYAVIKDVAKKVGDEIIDRKKKKSVIELGSRRVVHIPRSRKKVA